MRFSKTSVRFNFCLRNFIAKLFDHAIAIGFDPLFKIAISSRRLLQLLARERSMLLGNRQFAVEIKEVAPVRSK